MHLRFTTAGESHGKALVTIVEGLPAGLPVSAEWVDRELARRMQGYGRGARMKIERDRIEWLAGVRAGETLGSPVAMLIRQPRLGQLGGRHGPRGRTEPGELRRRRVTRPRPGHADLAGRAQVRPARRAGHPGAGQRAGDHGPGRGGRAGQAAARRVRRRDRKPRGLAGRRRPSPRPARAAGRRSTRPRTAPRCGCSTASVEPEIIRRIDEAKKAGDTLGGEVEVVARGVVVGLGSHVSWDRKLDGRLAGLLMSIPAVKGVEIGMGFEAARRPGSAGARSDRCGPASPRPPHRRATPAADSGGASNNAGGSRGRDHHRANRWWFGWR